MTAETGDVSHLIAALYTCVYSSLTITDFSIDRRLFSQRVKSILKVTEDKLCERAEVLFFYRRRKSPARRVEKKFSSDCTFLLAACAVFIKDTD